ncbi:hypothetical protein [Aerococcus urinae]|nr:hypothetical protein [Aerococcus urinae]MDK7716047.1 hypothetical protein [Aerococcus urinae]
MMNKYEVTFLCSETCLHFEISKTWKAKDEVSAAIGALKRLTRVFKADDVFRWIDGVEVREVEDEERI